MGIENISSLIIFCVENNSAFSDFDNNSPSLYVDNNSFDKKSFDKKSFEKKTLFHFFGMGPAPDATNPHLKDKNAILLKEITYECKAFKKIK